MAATPLKNPKISAYLRSGNTKFSHRFSSPSTVIYPSLKTSSICETLFFSSLRPQKPRFYPVSLCSATVSGERLTFDVVVVGAGIIGLTIVRQFLLQSKLSVAVVDAGVPCSGATGAGQGYIWMVHKRPGTAAWELANRSKQLWEELAEEIQEQNMDPLDMLGWMKRGSLLVGRSLGESTSLQERVRLLSEAGLKVQYLPASDLLKKEPSLDVGSEGGAAFVLDDCQLDAQRTVEFIEKGNKSFCQHDRYREFYYEPAVRLLRSPETGDVEAVKTSKNVLYSRKAIVIAAGAWSGTLMQNLIVESDISLNVPVKPRKVVYIGHLLILENLRNLQLRHGVMEVDYVTHQNGPSISDSSTSIVAEDDSHILSISMTATTDMWGNLVLGSSRQFTGFDTQVEDSIVKCIIERAGEFFPALRRLPLLEFMRSGKIRVGLRPYMHDGKPIIGPVPGLPKVMLATGHEGCGLSMALGTAEMVADMVLGNSLTIDSTPFSAQGRYDQ
ncbi:uncharacterized protein LOC18448548 isoform X1 [Amborella trichopoda]|uniref:uncharacterized protein LOC18448548 isoform X1 n=1 Tax=Amborella trichopoda TaxID=13333 RepID=UPI0005D40C18|nr:uncharacterized protein LOC18448548 isoform X1 [Amborella trichopoda]|eukprot:XP_011628676.1 uncharacterized protein LOC18448548 isoform X1 [Amborella trichopoda]